MHDPIIPSSRRQHFTTVGQAEVTTVHIASVPDDSSFPSPETQVDEETEQTEDVSDSAQVEAPSQAGFV